MNPSGGSGGLNVEISSGSSESKNVVSGSALALGRGSLFCVLERRKRGSFEAEKGRR